MTEKCAWCGKEFTVGERYKYCSAECAEHGRVKARIDRRARMRAAGLCGKCGRQIEPERRGRCLCQACAERDSKKYKAEIGRVGDVMRCAACGKEFVKTSGSQIYCCVACRASTPKKKVIPKRGRTCVICGKEFTATPPNQICCSPECARERQRQKMREYRETHPYIRKRPQIHEYCAQCGGILEPERSGRRLCAACAEEAAKKIERLKGEFL